jgi:hypothetical protein
VGKKDVVRSVRVDFKKKISGKLKEIKRKTKQIVKFNVYKQIENKNTF